jgi:hypothetical protein
VAADASAHDRREDFLQSTHEPLNPRKAMISSLFFVTCGRSLLQDSKMRIMWQAFLVVW